MGTATKDFSYSEFERSDTADRLGITNVISTAAVRDAVKALAETVLQPLRDAVGRPLHVNSGYRCDALNRAVGGVATSQHVKGEAADIRCDTSKGDLPPCELAGKALELGLPTDQVILYPNFVHFSHRLSGSQRGRVLYSKKYAGRRL